MCIRDSGELFFIVDSDDYITNDAVELINIEYDSIKDCEDIAGISFMRCHPNGHKIGSTLPFDRYCCNAFELTYKIHAHGDMAEVFKTSVIRQYPFPDIAGERFCPEALVWFRIARKYKILWINQCVYVCEYLTDGLTHSITRLRHKSPQYSMLFYSELIANPIVPFKIKLKSAINYWRFNFSAVHKNDVLSFPIPIGYKLFKPVGYLFALRDFMK